MKIDLGDVIIASHELATQPNGSMLEALDLSFARIRFTYPDAASARTTVSHDLKTQTIQ